MHFRAIAEFLDTIYEHNKMFVSCRKYTQCPYFREILCAVALMYYHFLRPFLVAVGTETVEGYKQLSHLELCSFYPGKYDCSSFI